LRFTLIKDIRKDNSMSSILNALLLFTFIYLISDLFVSSTTIGFSNLEIQTTLYGNEEEFLEPITLSSFLEYIHTKIFFMMMTLLTLSAVYLRLMKATSLAIYMVNIVMLSALVTIITLSIIFFLHYSSLLNLYILFFILWHIFALYMTLHSLWKLNYATSL